MVSNTYGQRKNELCDALRWFSIISQQTHYRTLNPTNVTNFTSTAASGNQKKKQ